MIPRQRLVTGALGIAGVAAIALPLVGVALALLMPAGSGVVNPGFGVYKVLVLATGLALLSQAFELSSENAWQALVAWWNRPLAERRATLGRMAAIALQLALLLLLIRTFEIENPAFWSFVAPLAFGGWAIHHLTAVRYRQPMFLFLSLAAIWLVFTPADGMWLVVLGVVLVGICHLPVPYWVRVAIVVAGGAALAAGRVEWFRVPWSRAIWPILGSMFMFRMIVYLYDLRHEKVPAGWHQRLGYFFLLPNVVFPLFPVVDYAAYRRTYYDAEAHRIYQRGIEWIFRGVLQLILYRLVYQYFMIPQEEVATASGVARFMVSNFLLYVRVSGQFHLIVGLLHLFGFHLPETHRRYYLASSFTDFWRRINIYWKDFMTKVFYYPLHFRLRRFGERRAMIVATLFVFVMTWALHSYQWFWLLGSFPVTATDTLFWGILAGLLVVNSLHEARHGRQRTLAASTPSWSLRSLGIQSMKVAGTFAAICVLWSLWMSPTFGDWLALWSVKGFAAVLPGDALPFMLVGAVVTTGMSASYTPPPAAVAKGRRQPPSFARASLLSAAAISLVLALSRPAVTSQLGAVGSLIASLRRAELSKQDVTRLQRGYYEDLMGVSRFNSQLWEVYMQRPPAAAWPALEQTAAGKLTNDFHKIELVPNARINFLGSIFSVNRWGMRDDDYEQTKPGSSWRIALMGASVEMGWGVGDGQSFEQVAERRLNREVERSATRYEILNFAVGAHTVPQQLLNLERVLSFHPDVVALGAHEIDAREAVNRLIDRARAGVAIPFDSLRSAARQAELGVVPEPLARKRLEEHKYELLEWMYRDIVTRVRKAGARPVLLLVPTPDRQPTSEIDSIAAVGTRAGFHVISLTDAYVGQNLMELQVTKWDYHPNARGHQLLGERLYQSLTRRPELIGRSQLH